MMDAAQKQIQYPHPTCIKQFIIQPDESNGHYNIDIMLGKIHREVLSELIEVLGKIPSVIEVKKGQSE